MTKYQQNIGRKLLVPAAVHGVGYARNGPASGAAQQDFLGDLNDVADYLRKKTNSLFIT